MYQWRVSASLPKREIHCCLLLKLAKKLGKRLLLGVCLELSQPCASCLLCLCVYLHVLARQQKVASGEAHLDG